MLPLLIAAVLTWDIQFAEPLALDRAVEVMDLDGEGTDAATVAALAARGVRAVCYISVGTHEDWRGDAAAFPPEVLGRDWPEWPGERYLDIRRLDVLLRLMEARIADCAAKGFWGVDPDNQDVHWAESGFPVTTDDQVAYSRALAGIAHRHGLAFGLKNSPDLVPALADVVDFAVTEDCIVDGWCADMAPLTAAGKPVLAIEYTDRPDLDLAAACADAARLGLSLIVKDRALTGASYQTCPATGE